MLCKLCFFSVAESLNIAKLNSSLLCAKKEEFDGKFRWIESGEEEDSHLAEDLPQTF